MSTPFTAEFFSHNRQALRKLIKSDALVVITAHGLVQRGGDTTYPFHQDSNFWYVTGIDEPDVILVMDGDHEYLITTGRDEIHQRFEGAIEPDALRRASGIQDVYDSFNGWKRLRTSLRQKKKVATVLAPPEYIDGWNMFTNPARRRLAQRLRRTQSGLEYIDLRPTLARMRQIKQEPELTAIQQAVDITVETLQTVLHPQKWPSYHYEYEVEGDLIGGYRHAGAESLAFAPIIAGGIRACTFHNTTNQSRLEPHELVVIDTGAEASHYNADISRTVAYGTPTDRQRAVFDTVLDTQQYAINLLKPGITFKEWDRQWRSYTGKKLIELGLITVADEASIAKHYPHYSHFLGLDAHDAGDYSRPFEPGMVLTCEPGIYIPEESIGVRIEDDILITRDGCKVLSDKLPRTLTANA